MKDLSTDQIGRLLVILRDNELIEDNEDIWKLLVSTWKAAIDKDEEEARDALEKILLNKEFNEELEQQTKRYSLKIEDAPRVRTSKPKDFDEEGFQRMMEGGDK